MLIYSAVFSFILTGSVTVESQDRTGIRKLRVIILTLFFFSGAVGLIYEVVWNRMLLLIFGSTVFAVTTVLTAFMGGMALGSFYFGRFVDRHKDPLRTYAYLEAGIGIFAILLPLILAGVNAVYVPLHRNLHISFYMLSFFRFLLCFVVLVIPTTLMGGTLPVISKFFTSQMNRLGWNIGILYAVNTFGAVLGCFSAGFILMRGIGVSLTIYISAGINVLIALIILLFLKKEYDIQVSEIEGTGERHVLPVWIGKIALWIFAISGFCALAYEVLWTRILVLFLGSTTYAFTTMLSAFLFGIALGSIILARFIDTRKEHLTILGIIQMCIALSAILLIPVFGKLYDVGMGFTGTGWWTFVTSKYALSFLVMIIPTTLMGATFPLVGKIYARSFKNLGRSIGNIYSINTVGGILGSFCAGFMLIPLIGVQKSIMSIAFLNIVAGMLAIVISTVYSASRRDSRRIAVHTSLLAIPILIIIIASVSIDIDKPITQFTAVFKGPGEKNKLLFYKEDIDASVTVVEDPQGIRRVFVDTNQAAEDSRWDLPSHSIIGHLPILLHPDPKNALVIGFGMGVTSWSISRHGVQVDAVEISKGVVEANEFFSKINHNVLSSPLVKLIVDDGRNYAHTTDKKYDMISTGIIHPLVSANSAGFYTKDFYELCKKILAEDGIMCQWVPLHRLSEEHFKMIIRTFKVSFPHTTLWYKFTPDFVILIGTQKELAIDFQDFKHRMENKDVRSDLSAVNMSDPISLLDSFMMDERTIDQYVGIGPIHTDDRPRMEFFNPQPTSTTHQNLLGMSKWRSSVLSFLTNIGKSSQEFNDLKAKLQQYFDATQHTIAGQIYYASGNFENARRQYLVASTVNPQDDNVKWLISHLEKQMGITETALLDRIKTNKGDVDAHIKLGTVYQNQGMLDKAIAEFKKAIEIDPDSLFAHSNLAYIYESQGRFAEAIEEFKELSRIKPDLAQIHIGLGLLYDRQSMYDDAIVEMKKALQLEPDSVLARINLGIIYRKKGMIDDAIEQFKKMLEVQPNSAMLHGVMGDLYTEKGDFSKAEAELKQALKLDPRIGSEPNFLVTFAIVYYGKGMYADAEREIKKAIQLEPDNKGYHELLEEIQKKR